MKAMHYLINFELMMDRQPLPARAQLLWYKLLGLSICFSSKSFRLDNQRACLLLGCSAQKLVDARRSLIAAGLLEFEQGVKGKPSIYRLLEPPPPTAGL